MRGMGNVEANGEQSSLPDRAGDLAAVPFVRS